MSARSECHEFSELVELIYGGATSLEAWDRIPGHISRWLGSDTCLIFTPQYSADEGGFTAKHQLALLDVYEAGYRAQNIWEAHALEKGFIRTGAIMRDQDLVSESEFVRSPFYTELLSRINIGRLLAGVIFAPQDNDGKLVVIAAHQPLSKPFTEEQAERLALLIPHLSRALGIFMRLRTAEIQTALSYSALDSLEHGMLIFNARMEVAFSNRKAISVLKDCGELALASGAGSGARKLAAKGIALQRKIDDAIHEVVSAERGTPGAGNRTVLVGGAHGERPVLLTFFSLAADASASRNGFAAGAAMIVNVDENVRLEDRLLRNIYQLTETEIRIAELLVDGASIKEVGAMAGVSENTVKTHAKRIYQKMGVDSRARLVRLLLRVGFGPVTT